jgi:HEAT repeat protein
MPFSRGQIKQLVLVALIAIALLLELIFQFYIGINVVYSHFFYIPIVIAAIWYGKRAVLLAVFFGILHIAGALSANGTFTVELLVRALMFVIVALVVGIAADIMRREPVSQAGEGVSATACMRPVFRGSIGDIRDRLLSTVNIPRLKEEQDIPGLVRALRNPDLHIQYDAVDALGALRPASAVPALMEVLTDDQYSAIRWKAAEALAQIGAPAVEPLIAVLSHEDEDVRWKAAIALGEIGDPRAIEPLIALLRDEDRFVKGRAAYALGLIGTPGVDALITALREGDGNLRWGAAIALGNIRDPRSVRPLLTALGDRYENVRLESAAALVEIGSTAVETTREFITTAGEPEALEAVGVLGSMGTPDAMRALKELLSHPSATIRERAATEISERASPSR